MRPSFCVGAALAILGLTAGRAETPSVRIGGTGAVTALMQSLGAAHSADSRDRIVVIPSLGGNGAIRALIDGALDIAIIGRPLTPQEQAAGLVALATMKTPFGFVSSRRNPPGLGKSDIATLYGSERATWPDGSALRLVLRPRSESDTELVATLFPGMREAQERARARVDIPVAATDQDNAKLAEKLEGSLAGISLTQIRMETRPLLFVAIDGVTPTLENLESGAYPYAKTLYVIASTNRTDGVDAFNAFLHSPKGRAALRAAGVLMAPES